MTVVYLVDQGNEASWCYLFGVHQSFQYCFSQYPSQVHTARQVHNTVGEELADKSGSKSYSEKIGLTDLSLVGFHRTLFWGQFSLMFL